MVRLKITVALLAALCLTGAGRIFRPAPQPDTETVRELGTDAACHTDQRAGYPREVSKRAAPSNTHEYFGYYVGGNCLLPRFGTGPGPLQGTYGWDYSGKHFRRNVVLFFCTRCKFYEGLGQYEPDRGPHVPNVLGLKFKERPDEVPPPLTDCRGGGVNNCRKAGNTCAPGKH
jgi:hypothetical protein